jgi:hypothetical protein
LAELEGVASNELISAATSTKITYDANGLVTAELMLPLMI